MNTAVATKMPACGSPGSSAGRNGANQRREQSRPRIGDEEQEQRPEIERELEAGIELGLVGIGVGAA